MVMSPLTIAMLSIHSSPLGILGTRNTGGMSVYVRELARELSLAGHRVDIFTRRVDRGDPVMTHLAPDVRLIFLDIARGQHVAKADLADHAEEALAAIESFRHRHSMAYDLIHSHYWISGYVGRLARRLWRCPHVITFHTLAALKADTGVGADEPTRRGLAEQTLVDECERLLVPCEGEMSNLMHYYGADANKVALVPGGVDRQRFRPMDQQRARQKLGLGAGALTLLGVGRLTPLKGQDRMIAALARLGPEHRARLVIVGGNGSNDPERQRLHHVALENNVLSQVRFCGSVAQTELADYYAAADMLVVASHYESFGLVGLEALACGRPVVTTPVGVMNSASMRCRTGVTVTEASPQMLAAGIMATAANRSGWSAHAIREAVKDFVWCNTAAATLKAYRSALIQRVSF